MNSIYYRKIKNNYMVGEINEQFFKLNQKTIFIIYLSINHTRI